MIRHLIFDLDGTLIDSTELILESFHHTRQVHFGDRLSDDYYAATFGKKKPRKPEPKYNTRAARGR